MKPESPDPDSIRRVVFAGPSLPHSTAGGLPADTLLLPPVKRGDVDDSVERFPKLESIGIVDGEFFQSFAISPKEILRAMDRGKKFFGSSSMGALRATELNIYGMTGMGRIYGMFASGELDADDEVAMTFDPETLNPASEPLANMRLAWADACDCNRLSPHTMDLAIATAKRIYYPRRTYRTVLSVLRPALSVADYQQLAACCESPANAKTDDAWELLAAMKVKAAS